MPDRRPTELDHAIKAGLSPEQPALPGVAETSAPLPPADERGRGRPAGTQNLSTQRYAAQIRAALAQEGRYHNTRGDPLVAATRIAAIDVTDDETLQFYATLWGCDRIEVVRIWAQVNNNTNNYHHQRLPQALIVNPGAPGGERVLLLEGDDAIDVTPEEEGA